MTKRILQRRITSARYTTALMTVLALASLSHNCLAATGTADHPSAVHTVNAAPRPRSDHSNNRYSLGAQTLTGGRFNPTNSIHVSPKKTVTTTQKHLVLIGKDTKAKDPKKGVGRRLTDGSSDGGDDGGGGGSYAGANGDSGGGGTNLGSINQTPNNIPPVTLSQARQFWSVVRNDFKRWDVTHDGKLSLPEMKYSLRNPAIKGDNAAALSALLVTLKDTPSGGGPKTYVPKYWSLEGLEKLVDAAQQTNHSRLINRFVQHSQALQSNATEKTPLFSGEKPDPSDIHKGPTDNNAFVAVAAGLARQRPQELQAMLSSQNRDEFSVKFPHTPQQEIKLTQGDVAEFASTGRSVLWVSVLQKAHEQIAEGLSHLSKGEILTGDKADAAQLVALMTDHRAEVLNTSQVKLDNLGRAISDALNGNRLVIASTPENSATVVSYDRNNDRVEILVPQKDEASNQSEADKEKIIDAPKMKSERMSLADLAKAFGIVTLETSNARNHSYKEIVEREREQSREKNGEDAAISELVDAGYDVKQVKAAIAAQRTASRTTRNIDALGREINLPLPDGSILVSHERHVNILTEGCRVHVSPSSAAYVVRNGDTTAVYNLSDLHSGQVAVEVGNDRKKVMVPLGQEVLITKDAKSDFEAINPDNEVAHRNVVPLGKIGDYTAYKAEFSFTSLLDRADGFQDLAASDSNADQKVVKRLIKTAAIMLTLRPPFDDKPSGDADKDSEPTKKPDSNKSSQAAPADKKEAAAP